MVMLKTVIGNFLQPARSRAPADMPPVPPTFRGIIEHHAELCTGCGTCAYVCSPKAISVGQAEGGTIAWRFFAGQCSFCGLCAAYCPTHAIANCSAVPAASGDPADHRRESVIPLEACPRCGTLHVPLPEQTVSEIPLAEKRLCSECRRRATSERIRDAFIGAPHHAAR